MKSNEQGLTLLYNVSIINTYVEYLQKYYPDISIEEVLEYAGLTRYQLEDSGHWYTQEVADRFQEIVNKKTRNPNISRDAGRYVVSSRAYKIMRDYIHGFIGPEKAYALLPKIHSKVTKGASIVVKKQDRCKLEVLAVPSPEVLEKPYQCNNRIGQFEAIAGGFTGHYAKVEHPECIHRGDKHCRYLISWKEPLFLRIKRYRNISLLYSLLACIFASLFLPHLISMYLLIFCAVFVSGVTVLTWYLENKDYKKQIEDQSLSAEMLIAESNARYNDAKLTQELGQAISRTLDIDMLPDIIMHILKNRLDFERGMILLANPDKTRLVYKAGYGLDPEQESYLRQNELHLDNPKSKGPFVVSFKERKPFLIDNANSIANDLSMRSKDLLHLSGSRSFICVPIVFENEPLGVLAVDRIRSSVPLKQNDLNILMGIAPQIAISINNTRTFERMQASEEKYRVLVESANSIILRINTEGVITFANRYALEFYGYTEPEMFGKNIIGLIVPEKDLKGRDLSPFIQEFLKNPEAFITRQSENIRKNGDRVWVSWSNKTIYDKERNISEILCVGSDITARRKAEHEKRQLEAQLIRAQKMEAIGALAGGVAHDLNNILSGITSYPELLLMEIPEGSPMRKAVQTIKKSGDKAAAMVQDLLTLARRGVTIANAVDLNTIVTDYFESLEYSKLKEYHPYVNFEIRLDEEIKYILGSEVHLSKTLMNLVSNAAEAMPKGGTVTVTTGNCYLEYPLKGYDTVAQGEYTVLSVEDCGIGISDEDIKRIFEPFFSKKTMGRSGTGLGMTVVWSTVKDHKGYIDVESEQGKGTRFDLYFPVTRHVAKEKMAKASINDYSGTEHILVVDDAEEQREITKNLLKKLGYKVDVAKSGEDAVEILKKLNTDLVILDMIMDPGIDGMETYKRILALKGQQKAIIVSGFSETDKVREAIKLGVGSYLRKPYALGDLAKAVRNELDKKPGQAGYLSIN
jgi:PAS domain S-box-containing protein